MRRYKKEKEAEFMAKTKSSSITAETAKLQAETDADIAQMKINFERNKAEVIASMLGLVTAVDV